MPGMKAPLCRAWPQDGARLYAAVQGVPLNCLQSQTQGCRLAARSAHMHAVPPTACLLAVLGLDVVVLRHAELLLAQPHLQALRVQRATQDGAPKGGLVWCKQQLLACRPFPCSPPPALTAPG